MRFLNYIETLLKPSAVLIIALSCFIIVTMDGWRSWHYGQDNFSWDVANYYSYLPAYITNHGSFELQTAGSSFNVSYLPVCPFDSLHIPKTTYGMALMYSPFYALGYKIAFNQHDSLDGFSEAFATTIHWGTIFYAILGLIFLRNFLINYFSEKVTTVTLLVLFLGTILFYYSVSQPETPHAPLFMLFSAFLLVNHKWHQKQKLGLAMLIGFLLGLISLIRPTELMIVLIFIFYSVDGSFSFKNKLNFFIRNYRQIIMMVVIAFLVWLPQLLFWKSRTGHLLYFSYGGEQFFWSDPQIMNVLFSYRKGLLLYTPLIGLAFIGFFFMKEKLKPLRNILIVIVILNLYLVSCWWDWFFGGSFGARAFVQHFSYLSIPLAAFISFVFEKNERAFKQVLQLLVIIVVAFGISLNLTQTYQYNENIIHFNAMSKKTYWLVFGKFKLNESERSQFWQSLKEPNYDKLRSGEDRNQ